jgi:uncharacterized protein YbaR (Trm112 family)
MRPDLLEILRCPMCRQELTLSVEAKDGDEILRGNLACPRCRIDYPISDGIPNLLPPGERD